MRTAIACLVLASTTALAPPAVEQFDPVLFEKRFHKADVDKNDRLSRKEAYSEFPRMPEFFDEIDSNKDKAITGQGGEKETSSVHTSYLCQDFTIA